MRIAIWITIVILMFKSVISTSHCTNDLLDDPFKRQLEFDSSQDLLKEMIKGTMDFLSFSLSTATQEPISAFSIQFCLVNTLQHIITGLDDNVEYTSFLKSTETTLVNDPLVREIFRPNSIKRWFEILALGQGLDERILMRAVEIIKRRLKWTVKEISKLEPEELDDFLNEFFLYPTNCGQITWELQEQIDEGIIDSDVPERLDGSDPSSFQVLQAIHYQDFKRISTWLRDSDLITASSSLSHLIALRISEYGIRKELDHKMSINFRVDMFNGKFKKPALERLKENLRIVEEYSTRSAVDVEWLLERIFSNRLVLIENCDICLVSNLVQDLLRRDSQLRKHCLFGAELDMEGMKESVRTVLSNLISFLRSLKSEEEMDSFLRPIHAFLFIESLESIQEAIDALVNIFAGGDTGGYYSYDEERRFKKEELVYCLGLGLYLSASERATKSPIKDFILTELLGIKQEAASVNDPFSRNQTFNTIDQLSTIGTFSVDHSAGDGTISGDCSHESDGSDCLLADWELDLAFLGEIDYNSDDENANDANNHDHDANNHDHDANDDNASNSFLSIVSADSSSSDVIHI